MSFTPQDRSECRTSHPRGGFRLFAVLLTVAVVAIGLGTAMIPRTNSLGPGPVVRASTGRDVHRHDFVIAWGWPWAFMEMHRGHMYVYSGDQYVPTGPSSTEVADWTAQAARLYAEEATWVSGPRARWYAQLAAAPTGGMRVMHWDAIWAGALTWTGASAFAWITVVGVSACYQRARRDVRGLCRTCGYDLHGSLDIGRCPECGTVFDPASVKTPLS